MAITFAELQDAFMFVNFGGPGKNEAYLDTKSGKVYCRSPLLGDFEDEEKFPDDIDDDRSITIPDKRDLDLGKPLVFDFVAQFLPDDYDEVRRMFSRGDAYGRYKDLLVRRGALEHWYEFENKAEEAALRKWCAENGIALTD